MASICTRKNGTREIQFEFGGKRPVFRLGKVSKAFAREALRHVKHLIEIKILDDSMRPETARWVAGLDPVRQERLVKCQLIKPTAATGAERPEQPQTLRQLVDRITEMYKNRNKNTRRNIARAGELMLERWGERRYIEQITPGDAEDFRQWLTRPGSSIQSRVTADETCRKARTYFSKAVKHRWLKENPFAGMKNWAQADDSNKEFVTRETIYKLLSYCEPEWQTVVALLRFGGLRPSELLPLRWEYVDFASSRFTVDVPKLAYLPGKEYRVVPIFEDLRPYLEEAYERAAPGEEWVVQLSRDCTERAFDSAFRKRLRRAGITPWKSITTSLRSSLQTELEEQQFPHHVVCAWLGNSPTVAKQHYLQVLEPHFQIAAGLEPGEQVKAAKPKKLSIKKRRPTKP